MTREMGNRDGGLLGRISRVLESFFLQNRKIINCLHIGMAVVFSSFLIVPVLLDVPGENDGAFDHFTTFSLYMVWTIWFPLVFISVVFTGRSWCGLLCPMGAASEWANKLGPKLAIPKWVQWPGTPVVSFLVVTIWAQTLGARDHAPAMAIIFGTTLFAALALGFLYGRNKRAWCRHMCPIGLALGVYSRLGAIDFIPKRPKPGNKTWTEKTLCPTMIDLPRKVETRHCIECFQCVRPEARGGLLLKFRKPGTEIENISRHNPNLSEIMFLFLGTGAALGGFLWLVMDYYQELRQMFGSFIIDQGWYWVAEPGPIWLMAVYPEEREVFRWLDFFLISGFMLFWIAAVAVCLSAFTACAAYLVGRSENDNSFGRRFVLLGYQFIPVAMISMILGLGGSLFTSLGSIGISSQAISSLKFSLFLLGAVWSLYLAHKIIGNMRVVATARIVAMVPGFLGTLAISTAWYPAIFI